MKRSAPRTPKSPKVYDERYFRRWYGARSVVSTEAVERRAHLALAAAEHVLERPVRSVLDVGCGEGQWRAPLRRLRPGIVYFGVDPSEYAVRRFGRRRNIRLGSFAQLGSLGIRRAFDLVICSDFLQYVSDDELRRGLAAVRRLARGLVYADPFTTEDEFEGDLEGWHHRGAAAYRRAFGAAGFVHCGLNCWAAKEQHDRLTALERCG
jgi:SAM-dependent methyltransferase